MRLGRIASISVALLAVMLLAGCASYPWYGGSYRLKDTTQTRYESASYEVLGPVNASGRSVIILGIFVQGIEGEGLLWPAAKEKYGDKVTGIKDITAAGNYTGILPPIYVECLTTYTGTAVQEKRARQ